MKIFPTIELFADSFIVIFLGVMIFYAIQLNKKLKILHLNKKDVEQAIDKFDQAVQKTEKGIYHLKNLAETTEKNLAQAIQQAQILKDELSFMNEKGEKIANMLDDKIRAGRSAKDQTDFSQDIQNDAVENTVQDIQKYSNTSSVLTLNEKMNYKARPRVSKAEDALKKALKSIRS